MRYYSQLFKKVNYMEYTLLRKKNVNCYLYGSIYDGTDFVCDTLEFGSGVQVPAGDYNVFLRRSETTKDNEIILSSQKSEHCTKLVQDNTYMYKEIRMRNENDLICIGLKVNYPTLKMDELIMHRLKTELLGYNNRHEKVTIKIVDYGR